MLPMQTVSKVMFCLYFYSLTHLPDVDEGDEELVIKIRGGRKERLALTFQPNKMPILPPWDVVTQGQESFDSQKEIIRSFVIEHYSMFWNPPLSVNQLTIIEQNLPRTRPKFGCLGG